MEPLAFRLAIRGRSMRVRRSVSLSDTEDADDDKDDV